MQEYNICFPDQLDLFLISMKERAQRKGLERGGPLEDPSVTFIANQSDSFTAGCVTW